MGYQSAIGLAEEENGSELRSFYQNKINEITSKIGKLRDSLTMLKNGILELETSWEEARSFLNNVTNAMKDFDGNFTRFTDTLEEEINNFTKNIRNIKRAFTDNNARWYGGSPIHDVDFSVSTEDILDNKLNMIDKFKTAVHEFNSQMFGYDVETNKVNIDNSKINGLTKEEVNRLGASMKGEATSIKKLSEKDWENLRKKIFDEDFDIKVEGGQPFSKESINNAKYIYYYFKEKEWTDEAIAGMLGNMYKESGGINPGYTQRYGGKGFGLVQWTDTVYIEWAEKNGYAPEDIDGQLERISLEVTGEEYQWQAHRKDPQMTFEEYTKSKLTPEELSEYFLFDYERPKLKNEKVINERGEPNKGEIYFSTK